MRVAAALLASLVTLTGACFAVAQESEKHSFIAWEIAPVMNDLHAGDVVHVMLRGAAAKKYAESIATENPTDDMCVFIRCTVDKLLDKGRLQISAVSGARSGSRPEGQRMFTFDATVAASEFSLTHVANEKRKQPPQIELWSLDGVSLRFWKPVDEEQTKK